MPLDFYNPASYTPFANYIFRKREQVENLNKLITNEARFLVLQVENRQINDNMSSNVDGDAYYNIVSVINSFYAKRHGKGL